MRIIVTVEAVLVAAALLMPSSALACTCDFAGPPCQGAWTADAVFTASAVAVVGPPKVGDTEWLGWATLRVRVAVDRVFLGDIPLGEIEIATGSSGASCGYAFVVGGRYLVYAHRSPKHPTLTVSKCSRTRLLAEAQEDLAYLERLDVLAPGARLFGTVEHFEQPDPGRGGVKVGPASGFEVEAVGDHGRVATSTDRAGHFDLTGLAAGSYRLRVIPRPGFSDRYTTRTVTLRDARACAEVNVGVRYDGRIAGRLVGPDGEPLAGVPVQRRLARVASGDGLFDTYEFKTGVDGRFELRDVSPGEYIVGVGIHRLSSTDVPLPPTWFRSARTDDATPATTIAIGPGQHVDIGTFRVAAVLPTVTVRGRISWPAQAAGLPVTVSVWDAAETWRQLRIGTRVADDGLFSFRLYGGRRYVVKASAYDDANRLGWTAESAPFSPEAGMEELSLILVAQPRKR